MPDSPTITPAQAADIRTVRFAARNLPQYAAEAAKAAAALARVTDAGQRAELVAKGVDLQSLEQLLNLFTAAPPQTTPEPSAE